MAQKLIYHSLLEPEMTMSGMLGQSIVLCNIRRVFERIKNRYGIQATFRKMFVIGGHGQHGGMGGGPMGK